MRELDSCLSLDPEHMEELGRHSDRDGVELNVRCVVLSARV